jgi:beta-phosphoglucomutase-like phosphatase (HAD superfamily)
LSPQHCLALEDSHQGLRAATQAGLKTVITRSSYTQEEDFSGAALVLDHLGEPESPFQVFAGDPAGASWFDPGVAQQLLESG